MIDSEGSPFPKSMDMTMIPVVSHNGDCSSRELREIMYRETANTYDKIAHDFRDSNLHVAGLIFQEINALLRFSPKNARILDVGCGAGVYASYIANQGCSVTAVDLSPHQIHLARTTYAQQRIQWICGNIMDFSTSKNEYDGILVNSSFHHILRSDRRRFLRKMFNALRDNGRMLLITRVHPFDAQKKITEIRSGIEISRHSVRTTRQNLFNTLAASGFQLDVLCREETHPKDRLGIFIHALLRKNLVFGN